MKRAAAIAYLLAVHALLVVTILRPETARHRLGLPNLHVQKMQAVLGYRDAMVPDGATIFLGDSITERMAVTAISPGAVNFGVSGARTSDLLALLPSLHSLERAGRIYLLIGVNDLRLSPEGLEARLAAISRALPNRPLVWIGLPANERVPVSETNAAIRRLCEAMPRCTFADVGRIDLLDGLHPSPEGYAALAERLRDLEHADEPDVRQRQGRVGQ